MDTQGHITYYAPVEEQSYMDIPGGYQWNPIVLDGTPFVAHLQQPLPQQQVYAVAPSAPAHMMPGQVLGHFDGQNTFQAQQAVAPQQHRNKLGRPKKEQPVQKAPKRKPGRPSGGGDVRPRLKRGEKAAMSPETKKVYMAKSRIRRKLANAAKQYAGAAQPPHVAPPPVPQAPTETWDSGYESASRPATANSEEPPPIKFDVDLGSNVDFVNSNNLADFSRHIGLEPSRASQPLTSMSEVPFDTEFNFGQQATLDPFFDPLAGVGQDFSSVPADSNLGIYSQPSISPGYYAAQQMMQPELQMEFNNYGQMNNYFGQVANNFGQDAFNVLQHPVTMPHQSSEGTRFEEVSPARQDPFLEGRL